MKNVFVHQPLHFRLFFHFAFVSVLFFSITMYLSAFFVIPLRLIGLKIMFFIVALMGTFGCYSLYNNDLRFYSFFNQDMFTGVHNIFEKKFLRYKKYKYNEIKRIDYSDDILIITVGNNKEYYNIRDIKDKRRFLLFVHNKTGLPFFNRKGQIINSYR